MPSTTTPKLNNLAPVTGRMINDEDEIHNVVDSFGMLKSINHQNVYVHEGTSFSYSAIASLLAAGVAYFLGRVGNLTAHLQDFAIASDSAPILIQFFEAPTVTVPGTLVTTTNRNRQSVNAATVLVYTGSTVSVDGAQLLITRLLGTQNDVVSRDIEGEWLLKRNTDYVFKLTNQSNQTANLRASFNWVESN